MSNEQIIEQIELWIRQGEIGFDALEILAAQAYSKEADDDHESD